MKVIDACGRACPEPVLLTQQALSSQPQSLTVLADNQTAVDNVTRFAQSKGYIVQSVVEGEVFRLEMRK